MKLITKKQENRLIDVVRCYQCIEEKRPHLVIIERAYPVKLHSNLVGGTKRVTIRRASETIYFCELHWKLIILAQKLPKVITRILEPGDIRKDPIV